MWKKISILFVGAMMMGISSVAGNSSSSNARPGVFQPMQNVGSAADQVNMPDFAPYAVDKSKDEGKNNNIEKQAGYSYENKKRKGKYSKKRHGRKGHHKKHMKKHGKHHKKHMKKHGKHHKKHMKKYPRNR